MNNNFVMMVDFFMCAFALINAFAQLKTGDPYCIGRKAYYKYTKRSLKKVIKPSAISFIVIAIGLCLGGLYVGDFLGSYFGTIAKNIGLVLVIIGAVIYVYCYFRILERK